jgi:hypothetical protein
VPRFTADIARKQNQGLVDALPVKIPGIILVDAYIDAAYPVLGHYEMFCTDSANIVRFNGSTCDAIAAAMPEMEQLTRLCQVTNDPYVCKARENFGDENIARYLDEELNTTQRSPYDRQSLASPQTLCTANMVKSEKIVREPAVHSSQAISRRIPLEQA